MTALLVACFFCQLPGSIDPDPRLSWYTFETEHFAVHFSGRGRPTEAEESLAARIALTAESVHSRLAPLTGWSPKPRTQIVVADFFDYANGWAAPLPDNTITIIPTLPSGDRTAFDDWLWTLLVHEYSHIIQMDMCRGFARVLRSIFGRAALPNALAPVWLLEGYALHNETRLAGFGRARSPEFDMAIRAAADAGGLLPIDRCAGYELERWPGANAPYLYGGLLHSNLARRLGPGIWDRYSLERSAGLPFFDNCHARRSLGRGLPGLWREWQLDVVRHADSVRRWISRSPLTVSRRLTDEGFATGSPCWSRTGAEVHYLSRNGREYPAIRAVDTTVLGTRTLHRGRVRGNMSLSPDGRWLAFAELKRSDHYDRSDIYGLELATGRVRRLTAGMRARDPDFAPDSVSLVFVAGQACRSDLVLLDLRTGRTENLTDSRDDIGYSGPRFSPRGRYIAVSVNRPGGSTDIEVIDRESGWTVPVTEDLANDLSPAWSRTGKHLFFVSDRTGVFNLFAYSMETGETRQCTNVLYGVFEPAVSPDNRRIALVSHSDQGDDIILMGLDANTWFEPEPFTDTLIRELPTGNRQLEIADSDFPRFLSALHYYSPFPTVLPRLWLPFAWYDSSWSFGAFTFGWDALQFHRYTCAAGYRPDTGPFLSAGYRLARYRPAAGLRLQVNRANQDAGLDIEFPFRTDRRSTRLAFSAEASRDTVISARYHFDFATSNALGYRFDVAPRHGAAGGLVTDLESRSALGLRDRVRLLGAFTQYLGPTPPFLTAWPFYHSSLRLRAALGTAFGDASRDSAWRSRPEPGALEVRGFPDRSGPGRNVAAASAQMRMPLAWPERGLSTAPVFLRNVNAALFADWAMTWNDWTPEHRDWQSSRLGIGAELRADLMLGHLLPASISVGYARGLLPEPAGQLYLRMGSPLLEAALGRRPDSDLLRN